MFRLKCLFFVILFLQVCSWQKLRAQQRNAYQFIEPNISISYDSNYFKFGDMYSNSFHKKADFILKNNKFSKTEIHIEPILNNARYITEVMLDSFMQARVQEFKNEKSNDFLIVSSDTTPIKINGFSCMGIILCDKDKKHFVRTIACNHASQNDLTPLTYISSTISLGSTSLQKDYQVLTKFLSGFAFYSSEQIATHDSLVRADFKVTVTQTQKQHTDTTVFVKNGITNCILKRYEYKAIIKVRPLSASLYKFKEARVKMPNGLLTLFPVKKGEVIFSCYDPKKGIVLNSVEVVLGNVLGKDVTIPFTFSYTNE